MNRNIIPRLGGPNFELELFVVKVRLFEYLNLPFETLFENETEITYMNKSRFDQFSMFKHGCLIFIVENLGDF